MAVPQKIYTESQLSEQINALNKKLGYAEQSLEESPTAFAYGAKPTGGDVSTEIRLRGLKEQKKKLESQILQEKWFGKGRAPEETSGKRKVGALEGVLNALQAPLYGVVGGIEALTGKGSAKGWANIQKNIEERGTFGDLLRSSSINNSVAAPLGLALDFVADPISMLTMGSGTLIPKIALGFKKAGIKGGLKGIESGFLEKAAALSRMIPQKMPGTSRLEKRFLEKSFLPEDLIPKPKTVGEKARLGYDVSKISYGKGISSLQERALKSTEEYEKLVGTDLEKLLDERSKLAKTYLSAGDIVKNVVSRTPYGKAIVDALDYSPGEWFKAQMTRDAIEEELKKKGKILGDVYDPKTNTLIKPTGEEKMKVMEAAGLEATGLKSIDDVVPKKSIGERIEIYPAKKAKEMIDESVEAADAPMTVIRTNDNVDRFQRMVGEVENDRNFKELINEMSERVKKYESKETGIKFYDDTLKKLNDLRILNGKPYVKNTLDAYSTAIGLFKAIKVSALSPSAVTNAVVGNMAMAAMAGLSLLRPGLMNAVWKTFRYLRGDQTAKFIKDFIESNPQLRPFFASHVNTMGGVLGMTPLDFTARANIDLILKEAGTLGDNLTPDFVKQQLMKAYDEIRKSPFEYSREMEKKGIQFARPTTFTEQELGTNEAYLRFKDWAKNNAGDNPVAKVLNYMMTKPVTFYEQIDQSFRLGNFLHMVNNGLEKEEIMKLSRFIPMESKDILNKERIASGGRYLYRLSPEKALEAVNMIYMNYAAMPGAIKVLRSLPIIGVPFASFGYGMGRKTIDTAMYNPAVFNRINFIMQEISGPQTPLEKEAMSRGYYENFNSPGMIRKKIFGENPFYLNAANMLPYLTLNLFSEGGRKYRDRFPDKMAEVIENMPLLKDPVGQLLFDYIIQPTLIRDVSPQSQFGAPLYPIDANAVQKFGYAGRQLLEAFTPTGPSALLGTLAGSTSMPEGAIEVVPSYRFRSLARAVRGEDPFGIERTEHPASRWLRNMFSTAGLPVSQMNLDFMAKELTKKKKQ